MVANSSRPINFNYWFFENDLSLITQIAVSNPICKSKIRTFSAAPEIPLLLNRFVFLCLYFSFSGFTRLTFNYFLVQSSFFYSRVLNQDRIKCGSQAKTPLSVSKTRWKTIHDNFGSADQLMSFK